MILGIFLYVGAEVGVNSWIATFLNAEVRSSTSASLATGWDRLLLRRALDRSPHRRRGAATSCRARQFLLVTAALSVLGTLGIMLGSTGDRGRRRSSSTGLGFGNVFPLIFSILIDRMPERSAELSGLMCMAIAGGAAHAAW